MLDVGASAGGVVQGLVWTTGCRAIGIEPSTEESEFARSRGANVRTGTLETVELEPASFDLALLLGTIDHLLDPFGDLRRIRALLKPSGPCTCRSPISSSSRSYAAIPLRSIT